MEDEKIKKKKESIIKGFHKDFLKKMVNFFDADNKGKFIYYICDIESMGDAGVKLNLDALNSLRRRKIIKKTGIKQDVKAKILNIDLSAPNELEKSIKRLNEMDMIIEEQKKLDTCFYHRLDKPCVYVELEKKDVNLDEAMKYLISLTPELYKPVKNKDGKFNITISKSDGIYYNERIKKHIFYAPLNNRKRFQIIHRLLKSREGESGTYLRDIMEYGGYTNLKHEIDNINEIFKKRLSFEKDLIVHKNSGGYSINFDEYFVTPKN